MFKNGGPIKEGIMDGMKEPQAINTVGSPYAPQDASGRQKYAAPLAIPIGIGLNALRVGAMRMAPRIANFFRTQVGTKTVPKQGPTFTMPGGNVYSKGFPGGKVPARTIGPGTGEAPIYAPNYFGRDPTVKLVGGVAKAVTSPTAKGIGGKAAQFVFSPTGIVTGAYFAGGKFFDKDGKEIPDDVVKKQGLTTGRQFTGDEAMVGDPRQGLPDTVPKEERQKLLDKVQKDRIEATKKRYYELMGLDKMSKGAIYDSLIGTSKAIQEEGADLKGGLKSGRLQSKIIDAFAKEIDKDKALKRQVDAAILKGEIEKDIASTKPSSYQKAAEEYAAMNNVSVSEAYKALGFDKSGDLADNIAATAKSLGANTTSNVYNNVLKTLNVEPTILFDTTTMTKIRKEDDYTNDADLVEKTAQVQGLAPGIYIVDKSAIRLDENGKATALYLG